jgi:competence protein ComEC
VIERADWDVFRTTGVAHLMSISGFHITMFAWVASLAVTALAALGVIDAPGCSAMPACTAGGPCGLRWRRLRLVCGWACSRSGIIWMLAGGMLRGRPSVATVTTCCWP